MAHIITVPATSPAAPSVEPTLTPPADYQNIQTSGRQFGTQVGEGLQTLGAGTLKLGEFYDKAAADQAYIELQHESNNILYGNPDDPNDSGFLGLTGEAAMKARPIVQKQLEDLHNRIGSGLLTGNSQLEFQANGRRLQAYNFSIMGRHYEQEAKVWGTSTNQAGFMSNRRAAALNYDSDEHFDSILQNSAELAGQQARLTGKNPIALSEEETSKLVQSRIDGALGHDNWTEAQRIYQKYGSNLDPPAQASIASTLRSHNKASEVNGIVNGILGDWMSGKPRPDRSGAGGGGQVSSSRAKEIAQLARDVGFPSDKADTMAAIAMAESSGNSNAIGDTDIGGSFGITQINKKAHGDVAKEALGNDRRALELALDISKGGTDFRPWTMFRNGEYRKHLTGQPAETAEAPATPDTTTPAGLPPLRATPTGFVNDVTGEPVSLGGRAAEPRVAPTATPANDRVPYFPTREELLSRIPEGLSDETYNAVYAGVNRAYGRLVQQTSADRASLLHSAEGGIARLQDGLPYTYDEAKIKHLLPQDKADELIDTLNNAKIIGDQKVAVRSMPINEALAQSAANHAQLQNALPGEYQKMHKQAEAFDKAVKAHVDDLGKDPAGYIQTYNSNVRDAWDAMTGQDGQAITNIRTAGGTTAAEDYAAKTLAEQERLGVPQAMRHVLPTQQARLTAAAIVSDPEQAPQLMKGLAQQYGTMWPHVWHDLGTQAKLPTSFQLVGTLENEHDAQLLARGLASTQPGEDGKNQRKPLRELVDGVSEGSLRPSYLIRQAIESDDGYKSYVSSLAKEKASPAQLEDLTQSVETLAQARMFWDGEKSPGDAAKYALNSAFGRYKYMPNGGARVPSDNYGVVTSVAGATVRQLDLSDLAVPNVLQEPPPGGATADDWLRQIKAAPTWLTAGNAVRLYDPQGRAVRHTDGRFVEVPFNVAAPPVTPTTPTVMPVY